MKRSSKEKTIKIKIRVLKKRRAVRVIRKKPSKKQKKSGLLKGLSLKILSLFLLIGLNWIGLSAVVGTLAYFNDTKNSTDNLFAAGSLDFLVDMQKSDNRFQTHTQGGWGSRAHGENPGVYRDANFDAAFPDGATIGDASEFTALFTDVEAVENFLPAGGTPGALDADYSDPTSTGAGVLAGQVLALTLNVGFDLYDPDFAPSVDNLGDYEINDSSVPCNGMAVQEVLDEANTILGGVGGVFSPSEINECATWINERFENGGEDGLAPGGSITQFATIMNGGTLDFQYTVAVEKTGGDDNFCNALNLEAVLEGTTHYSGDLMTFVSSPVVYSFSADEWEFIISLPFHAHVYGSCSFDFVFEGWQTNLESFGGFSDIERIDDPIHSAVSITVNSDDSGDTNVEVPVEEPISNEIEKLVIEEEPTDIEATTTEITIEEQQGELTEVKNDVIEDIDNMIDGVVDGMVEEIMPDIIEQAPTIEEQPVAVEEIVQEPVLPPADPPAPADSTSSPQAE